MPLIAVDREGNRTDVTENLYWFEVLGAVDLDDLARLGYQLVLEYTDEQGNPQSLIQKEKA